MASQELVRQLENAVDQLPEAFRIAFTLCVLDQMPSTHAAETLGVPIETLQYQAFRGRLGVRRRLGMRFDDAEARAFGLQLGNASAVVESVLGRLGVRAPEPRQG
jgi:hypothetical protein